MGSHKVLTVDDFNSIPNMKESHGRRGVAKLLNNYLTELRKDKIPGARVVIADVTGEAGASIDYYSTAFKAIRETSKAIKITGIEKDDAGLERKVTSFAIMF